MRLEDAKRMNEVLVTFVDGFVQSRMKKFKLWHFLRETSPVTGELEIRLIFFGEEKEIEHIREDLDEELAKLEKEKPELYSSHIFGNHGKPNERYEGEEDNYGEKGWNIFAQFLMKSPEVALRFLRDEPLGRSEKP